MTTTIADLDHTDDAADWLTTGHVLEREEVEYLRTLRLPEASTPATQTVEYIKGLNIVRTTFAGDDGSFILATDDTLIDVTPEGNTSEARNIESLEWETGFDA